MDNNQSIFNHITEALSQVETMQTCMETIRRKAGYIEEAIQCEKSAMGPHYYEVKNIFIRIDSINRDNEKQLTELTEYLCEKRRNMQELIDSAAKSYIPHPIDLSDVELNDALLADKEIIAKNVHEVWAQSRIAEGWTLGDKVDSEAKTTPCLIPYEELPESEKDYDRNTAFQTIKLLLKLGYRIEK